MEDQREALLRQIWAAQDEAYDLMYEYDSLPHQYGENTLYQSEAQIIDLIGEHPEITVTELAAILKKTPSACSQIVRKLRAKGWVEQVRNAENNRIFNLYLTDSGTEQTLTLQIGTENLDGDGYYVRVDDDTTIYQMNLDSVDALVSAAQSGLTEADTAEADTAAAETDADA